MKKKYLLFWGAVLCSMRIVSYAESAADARFLHAVAEVESGNNPGAIGDSGRSLGAFQMQSKAWDEANVQRKRLGLYPIPRQHWRADYNQRAVAAAFLAVIRRRYKNAGIMNPTPAQLAVVWNRGWDAAQRTGFRPNEYALRVSNLCR